ncbi:unnamed protein product [Cylindrotheca closterium]|uniref:Uncharacterized protein n=1 Tax=Cylindrotheca closterium TaxID=2856 RepID=A0AAD2FJA3_9STRA|nr:unnamed protein product [Cylindrotheca closterium]
MGFFQNKMSRNGNVRDALAKLRTRHNAIIERRKTEREAAKADKASTLASSSSPSSSPAGSVIGRNSLAELDSVCPRQSNNSSVAELDSVCPKSPSKTKSATKTASKSTKSKSSTTNNNTTNNKIPSVAEWLLWGDDESVKVPQTPQPNHTTRRVNTKPTNISANLPLQRGSSASPVASKRSPQVERMIPAISESHSFDNSQLDSHFYSEFTDDYTVDDSLADVTLASSKEPGLFAHGLMAVGELFTGAPSTPAATPSPQRRRKSSRSPRRIDEGDDESDVDEESTQAYSTYAKDDSCLTGKYARDDQSATTATTASSSPSAGFDAVPPTSRWNGRRNAPVKYHNMTNVNIIESFGMEVEMSLETVTRIEI